MTAIEKFTFALSFDDADNVIRSAGDEAEYYELGKKKKKKKDDTPPPPPPVYTEEQGAQMVADAEKKGHEAGFSEGHKQGFEEAHQQIMESLEKAVGDVESVIAEKLDQIDEQQKRANAKINEDAIHVALGVIRKLAPAWSKQYQLTEIEDIIRQCLANLFEAPKVMIKVNPDLETDVRAAAERIAESRGFSGKVVIVGEPEVAVGDCMVSWGDGTAVRDSARVWSEINTVIDNAMALHASEHDLPPSDMGDPEVQESRLPEEPPAPAPEPAAASEHEQDHATAPQAVSPDMSPPPTETPATGFDAELDAALDGSPEPTPDATAEVPLAGHPEPDPSAMQAAQSDFAQQVDSAPSLDDPAAAQPSAPTAPQEGDGTADRNVQTSQEPEISEPIDAPEISDETVAGPTDTHQSSQISGDAENPTDAAGISDIENVAPPSDEAMTRPEVSGADRPEEQVDQTDAEEMAAAKQPTKDAGDENG
jgi:flagellar assembly protein FliH